MILNELKEVVKKNDLTINGESTLMIENKTGFQIAHINNKKTCDFIVLSQLADYPEVLDAVIEFAKTPVEERIDSKKAHYILKSIKDLPTIIWSNAYLNYDLRDETLEIHDYLETRDIQTKFTELEYLELMERFNIDPNTFVREEIE